MTVSSIMNWEEKLYWDLDQLKPSHSKRVKFKGKQEKVAQTLMYFMQIKLFYKGTLYGNCMNIRYFILMLLWTLNKKVHFEFSLWKILQNHSPKIGTVFSFEF